MLPPTDKIRKSYILVRGFWGEGHTYSNVYHFTGKERDYESNLDNFGARYDASNFGRFTSPDPFGGHQEDPQDLNRYTYVRNNPLNLTDPTGLDFYLQCNNSDHSGCVQVQIDPNNDHKTWVQADIEGNEIIVTSDSIRAGDNTATVSGSGVTINGNSQGIYFDNPESQTRDDKGNIIDDRNPITLPGSGALQDFSVTINGNCNGTCLSSGTWTYPGTDAQARQLLYDRGSRAFPGEDLKARFGFGDHPHTTQHRFGGPTCGELSSVSCPNSPHISVPIDPKFGVPRGFHVDAHGDAKHHSQDVDRKGVE